MVTPLVAVFGTTSLLLGIYILFISLLATPQKPYSTCFLSDQPTNKAFTLRNKLAVLQRSGQYARTLQDTIKSSVLLDPEIRSKSVQLTKSTEDYIQRMTLLKRNQESNMEFFARLSSSRASYEKCVTDLKQNLDLQNSKNLWISYQTCSNRYETLKNQVQTLYSKRGAFLKDIDVLLASEDSNPNFDYEEQLKKIREKYERLNAQNDKNKEGYIIQLKKMQQRNQTKAAQHDEIDRVYSRATLEYDICLKNLKQFKKCEDISNALKEYGYVEPVESLEKQIKSKRQIVNQLAALVMQSKIDGKPNNAIHEMYKKRTEEFLETIKLNVLMGVDEMKECGCTEETRNKLQGELESSKVKMDRHKQEMNEISYEILKLQKMIKGSAEEREKLARELIDETERLKNRETANIMSLKEKLQILRRNLGGLNREIGGYERKLMSLEFECNQYKERLGEKIKEAEEITECLRGKDLYEGLREKAGFILRGEVERSVEPIEGVRKALERIEFLGVGEVRKQIEYGERLEEIGFGSVESVEGERGVERQVEKSLEKEVISIVKEVIIKNPSSQTVSVLQEQRIMVEDQSGKEF